MKRLRWIVILAAGVTLVTMGAATVLARSTYTSHAMTASSFISNGDPVQWHAYADNYGSGDWWWLGAGKYAKWTFDDVSGLQGSVTLNFSALSTSPGGGSGYSNAIKVVVSGAATGTFTTTLANPWKPHIGPFSAGIGWDSHAGLTIPSSIWAGAGTLTVTVTPVTSGNWIAMNKDALLIGYATL